MLSIAPYVLSALSSLLAPPADGGTLRFVESFPVETTLDAPDIPQTAAVWLDMIQGAKREIVLSHFYASTAEGSALNTVIDALKGAAARGVSVRFLLAERFRELYPDVPQQLGAVEGIDIRYLNYKAVAGGVMHAKYMVTDRARTFLGSPNFDFRSLDQIQELGVDIKDAVVAQGLGGIFDMDWALAGGEQVAPASLTMLAKSDVELHADQADGEATTSVTLCGSPATQLPGGVAWDLPLLIEIIDNAKANVRAQVLTYDATGYDKGYFAEIETALRRAAARGVHVQLIVADWCKRKGAVDGIQSLAALNGIDVSFMVVPEWSEGFVPFSRVVHAKLCVADERAAWIGSSNWEGSYFTTSRNVSVILEGEAAARRLARWFDTTWASDYREAVVPGKEYVAPRRR